MLIFGVRPSLCYIIIKYGNSNIVNLWKCSKIQIIILVVINVIDLLISVVVYIMCTTYETVVVQFSLQHQKHWGRIESPPSITEATGFDNSIICSHYCNYHNKVQTSLISSIFSNAFYPHKVYRYGE